MSKLYKRLPMIVFIGFIAVMLILFIILPKKEYSSSEKRYLQEAPELNASSLFTSDKKNSFQTKFEKYIEDHTAGRNFWVGFSAYYNLALGNNGEKGVYKGADDYLINDPEAKDMLARNSGFMEEFAQQINVPVTVAVAPSTGWLCPDKLPRFHYTYLDDERFAALEDTFDKAEFIDLRDGLKEAYDGGHQVFYRTDHHWTAYGAYTAYRALSKTLGYTPHEPTDYSVDTYEGFYGTTYSTSGFWLTPPDSIEVWDNKLNDGDIKVSITDGENTIEQDDMFFYSHLDEDDKYPVYLDGNHPYTVIKNTKLKDGKKLMVIKDSFAHSMVPFLADHYSEIIMVDLRYYSYPLSEIISCEGVDRVLMLYSLDNLTSDDNIAKLG